MGTFKVIEVHEGRRTGREFRFDAENRQGAIDALVRELGVAPETAHADPARTLVQIGDARWSIVAVQKTVLTENSSLRRGGAKHKQVR